MRTCEVVSTDSHLEVPPYFWGPFVDAEFRAFVPKVVQLPRGAMHGRSRGTRSLCPSA
jgi:hypothetical protein